MCVRAFKRASSDQVCMDEFVNSVVNTDFIMIKNKWGSSTSTYGAVFSSSSFVFVGLLLLFFFGGGGCFFVFF